MSFNTAFPRQPLGISDTAKPPTDDPIFRGPEPEPEPEPEPLKLPFFSKDNDNPQNQPSSNYFQSESPSYPQGISQHPEMPVSQQKRKSDDDGSLDKSNSKKPKNSTQKSTTKQSPAQNKQILDLCDEINQSLKAREIEDKNRHVTYQFFTSINSSKDVSENFIYTCQGLKQEIIDLISSMPGFEASNLSNMMRGARAHPGEAIKALKKEANTLMDLAKKGPFTASNLSSILGGSGAKIGEAIKDLKQEMHKLIESVNTGPFTASNLSSIFTKAGANVKKAIENFKIQEQELRELVESGRFTSSSLSTRLHGKITKIGEAIKDLEDSTAENKQILALCHEINQSIKHQGITDKNRHVTYQFFTSINSSKDLSENFIYTCQGLKSEIIDLISSMPYFTIEDLSSILKETTMEIGEVINTLKEGTDALTTLVNQEIFAPADLYRMLYEDKKNIPKIIKFLKFICKENKISDLQQNKKLIENIIQDIKIKLSLKYNEVEITDFNPEKLWNSFLSDFVSKVFIENQFKNNQ
jgi:predicted chitinase